MKKGIVLLVAVILVVLWGSQVLAATKWYSAGYGRYNGLPELSGSIRGLNSWTQNLGLDDFEIPEPGELTIYSAETLWELNRYWGIELGTVLVYPVNIDESAEKTIPLQGGGQKSLSAESRLMYFMTLMDLMGRYCFRPSSRLTFFAGGGPSYLMARVEGAYYVSEMVYTPPSNYEYRHLNESFSASTSQLGGVIGGGVDVSLGKYFRIGLEAKYHWFPDKMIAQTEIDNEGFASLPIEPDIEMGPEGMSYGLYLMLHF